jgi:serine/threonine protein kinase
LPKPPSREDLEFTFSCAKSNAQVPLGLMWKQGARAYLLTVMAGQGGRRSEPAWVLHAGTDAERRVLWSYRTSDLDFVFNLLRQISTISGVTELAPSPIASGDFPAWVNDFSLLESALEPGTIFAEQYEIGSEIGLGGMGLVYKAHDRLLDRTVAVKVLHGHLVSDPVSKKRFEQEAKAAMTLAHPNLISVYHYGFTSHGLPFLVMEYIDGTGLDVVLAEKGKLDLVEFLEVFIQSCEGLAHAHDKRIIHRDLKPSNIMLLNGAGTTSVKIVDFGIAKLVISNTSSDKQDLTISGDVIGSPLYMSPEQCKGDPLDLRSDIYSLGCLMYQAISGKVPFEGESALQTMGKHICEQPPLLSVARTDLLVPSKLQELISKMLEKAPEDRFDSVRDVQKHLRSLAEDLNPGSSSDSMSCTTPNTASQLLVDSGGLPVTTLQAALKVQKMLRAGSLTLNQAADALGRAHLSGGQITVSDTDEERPPGEKGIETPVEAILLEAGLITNAVWRTLISLHLKVRTGRMSKEDAIAELNKQLPHRPAPPPKPQHAVPKDVFEMIRQADILSAQDIEEARAVAQEEGTDLAKRLVIMGKLDNKTLLAARQCLSLIESDRLKVERAVIALGYCHRSRVGFYQAVEDLGWERP